MKKSKEPRILLWDIETTNLVADYGWILCIAFKWLGEKKTHLISIHNTKEFRKDRTNDRGVIRKFLKHFSQADLHVHWFGEYFDFPFVQTRLLVHGEKPLPAIPFVDGWKIAKKSLKLRSNRLDAVSKITPVKGKREEKLQPTPDDWRRSMAGHIDAIKTIGERCKSDVRVLEQNYEAIRPFTKYKLPNISKLRHPELEGCPACGDKRIQKRGYGVNARNTYQKCQCQECGHWFSVPMKAKVK